MQVLTPVFTSIEFYPWSEEKVVEKHRTISQSCYKSIISIAF